MRPEEMAAMGMRVRQARQAKQMTMSDLARHANVAQAAISQVESGRAYPSMKLLLRLSEVLGTSISELVSGVASGKSHIPPPSSRRQTLREMEVESPAAHALMKDVLGKAMGGPLEEY